MVFGEGHLWSVLFLFHNSCIIIASLLIILHKSAVTTLDIEKKHYRVIFCSCLLAVIASVPIIILLLSSDPEQLTFITHVIYVLFFTGFIMGVRHAIKKYSLESINPESPAPELISGIREPVFLITAQGDILCRNSEAGQFIGQDDTGDATTIFNIFTCEEVIHKAIDELLSGKSSRSIAICWLKNRTGQHMAFALHLQGVRDKQGQLAAIMMTAQEDPETREFRERYRITERQMEIISLAVSGLSNREIAVRLNLADRTVENHLCNIYNKLGINNKIELYSAAARYNFKTS